MTVAGVSHEYADVNGLRLHYARAGSGPLIVFLHGFPQCWYEWRHQLAEFGRDHLAVAPDLRGYNLSDKPAHLSEYGPWKAAEDVRALADHLGADRFVLVGHDWGAATGWSFALHHPERLERLVILSTAHPVLFDRALREEPEHRQPPGPRPVRRDAALSHPAGSVSLDRRGAAGAGQRRDQGLHRRRAGSTGFRRARLSGSIPTRSRRPSTRRCGARRS